MARRRWIAVVGAGLALAAVAGLVVALSARPRAAEPLPRLTIAGVEREEGCLLCHASTQGLGPGHAELGCSACHEGDATAREAEAAHRGMVLLVGDLGTVARSCGAGACHPIEAARVQASLMAGAPGILAVDRFAFGERPTPDGEDGDSLRALAPDAPPASPAESHARQLCATCHLGLPKERRGDLGEAARGGGCTACHLAAPWAGRRDTGGPLHPDISAAVPEKRCYGCHARSGRISLSYRGVVELEPGDPRVTAKLFDGRPSGRASEDVHATAGLGCIDCHTERELMGDGVVHRHAHEALDVACGDCHLGAATPAAIDADREAVATRLRATWPHRALGPLGDGPPLHTRAGTPLWHTDATARTLRLVTTGEVRPLGLASEKAYHALVGHERLSCQACHAVWAPRCTSCHTRFDPAGEAVDGLSGASLPGRWSEEAGGNGYGPPLLALGPRGHIEPFVEGMRLVIEGAAPSPIERELYAPLDPHTTGKARTCVSCHDPDALDAVYPPKGETTRSGARLLDTSERARIAEVGRCLPCHDQYDDAVFRDFAASRARLERARGGGAKPRDEAAAKCGAS